MKKTGKIDYLEMSAPGATLDAVCLLYTSDAADE